MLIWELRPRTVIELGAAAGGSALWLADVMTAFGIGATIKSVDLSISRITVRHPAIEFVRADLSLIPGSGLPLALPSLPHPWLIIGDAHVNLAGVLEYLDQFVPRAGSGITQPGFRLAAPLRR